MQSAATQRTERISLPFWKPRATATPLSATALQQRYLSRVLNYVTVRIGGSMEAEDITAEVFAAAFTTLHRCPPPVTTEENDPVRAWLFGIARRKLVDSYRRRSRRPEVALPPGMPAPNRQEPEARILADEAMQTLQGLVESLPELQREALRLKYIEELSLEEIGWILRRSPGAVGQLLHRARHTIRTRGGDYFGNDPIEEESR